MAVGQNEGGRAGGPEVESLSFILESDGRFAEAATKASCGDGDRGGASFSFSLFRFIKSIASFLFITYRSSPFEQVNRKLSEFFFLGVHFWLQFWPSILLACCLSGQQID